MLNEDKLKKVKSNYQNLNDLHFRDRLVKSAPVERWIIDTINHHGIPYQEQLLKGWRKTRSRDDKTYKRDVELLVAGKQEYGQVKFRQPNSGTDIGIAIFQPYPGLSQVKHILQHEGKDAFQYILARDYKFDGIFYAVLNNTWEKLIILPHQEVLKPAYQEVLAEWLADPSHPDLNTSNRTYFSKKKLGVELKYKKDSGRGFDSMVEKVICYLPVTIFETDARVVGVDMIDPPDYLI